MDINDSLIRNPPQWIPDTKNCFLCQTTFSILNRRHHCRGCGRVICGSCSKHSAKLPQYALISKEERICDTCNELQGKIERAFHRTNDLNQKIKEGMNKQNIFETQDKETLLQGVMVKVQGHKKDRKLLVEPEVKHLILKDQKGWTKSEIKAKITNLVSIVPKEPASIVINKKDESDPIILKLETSKQAEDLARKIQNAVDYKLSKKQFGLMQEEYKQTKAEYEELIKKQNPNPVTDYSDYKPKESFLTESQASNSISQSTSSILQQGESPKPINTETSPKLNNNSMPNVLQESQQQQETVSPSLQKPPMKASEFLRANDSDDEDPDSPMFEKASTKKKEKEKGKEKEKQSKSFLKSFLLEKDKTKDKSTEKDKERERDNNKDRHKEKDKGKYPTISSGVKGSLSEFGKAHAAIAANTERFQTAKIKSEDLANNSKNFYELCKQLNDRQ